MLEAILSVYPNDCQPTSCKAPGNAGGFSGAQLWKLKSPKGALCVRRWPAAHPTVEGLRWIHQVLAHVHERNGHFVPLPLQSLSGNSFLLSHGHLWEVTPWMPGEADFRRNSSDQKLEAAMGTLARFHLASQSMQSETGISSGLKEREEFSTKLLAGDLQHCQSKLSSRPDGEFLDQCREIVRLSIPLVHSLPDLLRPLSSTQFALQPCLRDIWHDHVLFTGEEVSGLIDFGAMRMETVASDIARLLGSLAGNDDRCWDLGLAAYEALRPLMDAERLAVDAFDRANVALSGLNWVRWLILDDKKFDNTRGVHQKLDATITRLRDSNENGTILS